MERKKGHGDETYRRVFTVVFRKALVTHVVFYRNQGQIKSK